MERKIGEIFEYDGEWFQCVEDYICDNCSHIGFQCISCPLDRKDKRDVYFKKLKKVGEPFISGGKLYQHYKVFDIDNIDFNKCTNANVHNYNKKTLTVEIKQNQEDMEEKKLNLKPFDIQKAREGEPVYTRDGRKARIVCYDFKGGDYPIIALVECRGNREIFCAYSEKGEIGIGTETDEDLMIAPELHEGWVNVFNHGNNDTYVGNFIFPTEELAKEALSRMDGVKYIATVKIEWEE